uniref:Fibronectin type-III domain-containing protein n=1 Tax=Sparus aurata TaxID=8175 RepID=A0A671WZ13_SPAAU
MCSGNIFNLISNIVSPDVRMLSAPSGVSMESVDMRHVLKWRPLQAPCNTTVLYSVQFQGEFELSVLHGSWVDAPECQQTRHTRCDLTLDLGSDSDYNVHVRAQCGSTLSPWTDLSPPFNRRDTVLTVPEMLVTAVGDVLQVSFNKLPHPAVISVTVWRKGDEQQVRIYFTSLFPSFVLFIQEGAEYCVRAQTVLNSQLHSSSTAIQCVSITGTANTHTHTHTHTLIHLIFVFVRTSIDIKYVLTKLFSPPRIPALKKLNFVLSAFQNILYYIIPASKMTFNHFCFSFLLYNSVLSS